MIPSAENIDKVYNLRRVAELAFKFYLQTAELKTFTSQTIPTTGDAAEDARLEALGWNIIDFRQDRPRVEIIATRGPGQNRFIPHPQYAGVECETTWAMSYDLTLVTRCDMRIHTAYQTMLDYQMNAARGVINGVAPLELHYVGQMVNGGVSPIEEKTSEGVFISRFNFGSLLSVQKNAWPLLTQ